MYCSLFWDDWYKIFDFYTVLLNLRVTNWYTEKVINRIDILKLNKLKEIKESNKNKHKVFNQKDNKSNQELVNKIKKLLE